ncbi:MAG: folylpolyglutamate synthase/dihydrofolate synthase family protein [Peptoniphilus sp.]|nr:folylpolyglutamate synthase/dihydrofolate synthase family protein [Peptoniphilus sp.]
MDYINWMLDRGDPQGGYSLDNVKALLNLLGNPQDKIKILHVAGTNGKGSLLNYLSTTLTNSNIKCGEFISPYVDGICEAVKINNEYISLEDFTAYLERIYELVLQLDSKGMYVTTFEIFSAMSYLYFYEQRVDIALIEVGMGGRTDGTNTMKSPLATVITPISFDHVAILGNTLEEIAYQKGGIIKENSPLFLYPQRPEALEVLKEIAEDKNAPIHSFTFDEVEILRSDTGGNVFNFRNHKNVRTSLIGEHQAYNAALALMILDELRSTFELSEEVILKSIFETKNIARLEVLSQNPTLIIDGSHNLEGMEALLKTLKLFDYDRLIVGFSMLKDKDVTHISEKLLPLADEIVLTEINNPRKSSVEDLYDKLKHISTDIHKIPHRREAFEKTLSLAQPSDLILWCGSLYLMADIRKYARELI